MTMHARQSACVLFRTLPRAAPTLLLPLLPCPQSRMTTRVIVFPTTPTRTREGDSQNPKQVTSPHTQWRKKREREGGGARVREKSHGDVAVCSVTGSDRITMMQHTTRHALLCCTCANHPNRSSPPPRLPPVFLCARRKYFFPIVHGKHPSTRRRRAVRPFPNSNHPLIP